MADILYTYKNQVYANITNQCDCRCTFCIRNQEDAIGDADTLWHQSDPSLEEIIKAIDAFDFTGFQEFVYCGYGEPTCALDILIASAEYVKNTYGLPIRINTNGLANLYHKKNIVPLLAKVTDTVSISLNAPTKEQYDSVTRPLFPDAFDALLDFAVTCRDSIPNVMLSIVDVLPQEDIDACRQLADSLCIPLRIRKFSGAT